MPPAAASKQPGWLAAAAPAPDECCCPARGGCSPEPPVVADVIVITMCNTVYKTIVLCVCVGSSEVLNFGKYINIYLARSLLCITYGEDKMRNLSKNLR